MLGVLQFGDGHTEIGECLPICSPRRRLALFEFPSPVAGIISDTTDKQFRSGAADQVTSRRMVVVSALAASTAV